MPPGFNSGQCWECFDGAYECGDDPCKAGGVGIPYQFRGVAWMPVEMGLDAAIRVYARAKFKRDKKGDLVMDKGGDPVHTIDVWLDLPFRHGCVYQGECTRPMKASRGAKAGGRAVSMEK